MRCSRAASLLTITGATLLPVLLVSWGCRGGDKTPATSPTTTASSAPGAAAAASASVNIAPMAGPSVAASIPPAPVPTSTVATTKTDPSWAACHQSFKARNKDVVKDVAAMAKACEQATAMKLVGKPLTGSQADTDAPQTFPLEAKGTRCYRVYAQAAEGIKDLDVVIKDSDGVIVGQDSTDDPSPVVLEDGAVCFGKPDKASIVVSVGMGKGSYALEVWEK